MEYGNSTNYVMQGQAVSTKRGEISERQEHLDKCLEELNAEVFGLNGTFGPILRSKPPEVQGVSATPSEYSTEFAGFLHGACQRVLRLTAELRDLRARCEL